MATPPPFRPGSDDDLALALRLADAADAETMRRFGAVDLDISRKADRSHVTEADLAAERAIRAVITAERPDDGIFGEEFGESAPGARRWILDPIDGTANYLRGVPAWGTMIALEVDGVIRLGVVSMPAFERRWWAAEGQGAWTNSAAGDRRIQVSDVDRLEDASLSFQSIAQWRDAGHLDALLTLQDRVWRDRAYGDVWSYMLLAEGRVDIVGEFDVKEYDIAAAAAIVREAGGSFTSFEGRNELTSLSALASNGVLHDDLVNLLQGADR
ncbi:inositol monophosphatase family protein [Microbacterium amylolyticum]|uniref:inositol-phosphate phosphatase n=1 Tax=Microbacterium amylolyticum TaxID=936337 RepID=A0ABS4ZF48_9MICO|nr:inositol monophosphatase family protein [Microbacterium amylolyticum]MBP2435907.1 histidinol-phosphatase [Microbacterium amylolyticum]